MSAADVLRGAARYHVEQGDALAFARSLPADCLDGVITDSPYCSGAFTEAGRKQARGQGLRSETVRTEGWFDGDNMGTAGLVWLLRSAALEAYRTLHEGGSALFFCDWRMVANLGPALESSGLRWQNLLVWDKGSAGLGAGFRAQHELVLHYVKGTGVFHDATPGNVLRAGRMRPDERVHQTQKPVDLLAQMVPVVAPPDGIVADFFAGSGSIGVAALLAGRRFLGVEREARHVATARERCAGAVGEWTAATGAQGSLFAAEGGR